MKINRNFIDLVDTSNSPFDNVEGRTFGNFIKKDEWLENGSSKYTNKLIILESGGTYGNIFKYKTFSSDRIDEKQLIIGILRETKIPEIYYVDLVNFDKIKAAGKKMSEEQNKRLNKIDDYPSDMKEMFQSSFDNMVGKNPDLKKMFSDMAESNKATYTNSALYTLTNIMYKNSLFDNKRNISGINSLQYKSWMFRDQDLAKLENNSIESRFFIQTNDIFHRYISFYNDDKFDNVFLYGQTINNQDIFDKLCEEFNPFNILSAFQKLIDENIIDDFPDIVRNKFKKYIEFE